MGNSTGGLVYGNIDSVFIGQLQAFDQVDVLKFVDGIHGIGDQFPQEDLLFAVKPFLIIGKMFSVWMEMFPFSTLAFSVIGRKASF